MKGENLQLIVEGLSTFYGEAQALNNVSLSVANHQVAALLGRSSYGRK